MRELINVFLIRYFAVHFHFMNFQGTGVHLEGRQDASPALKKKSVVQQAICPKDEYALPSCTPGGVGNGE